MIYVERMHYDAMIVIMADKNSKTIIVCIFGDEINQPLWKFSGLQPWYLA